MNDLHRHNYELQEEMCNTIVFLSTVNKERDMMYYHKDVKQQNSKNFILAIVKKSIIM